jgi:hypothetical protein
MSGLSVSKALLITEFMVRQTHHEPNKTRLIAGPMSQSLFKVSIKSASPR